MDRKFMVPIIVAMGVAVAGSGPWLVKDPDETRCVLQMEHQHQQNSKWCWVATVSPVLRSLGLQQSSQCELYDLSFADQLTPTKACSDMAACDAAHPDCWTSITGNNEFGAPEYAASAYRDKYTPPLITVTTRESPDYVHGSNAVPLSFEEIREQICVKGEPFIWAYIESEEDGHPIYHDVVVFGFVSVPGLVEAIFANDPNGLPYDPALSLEPYTYQYAWYADDSWAEDVMISPSWWLEMKRWWQTVKEKFL